MARMVWVNVYEADRAYGGPEEGGWWYDVRTPAYEVENVVYVDGEFGREVVSYDRRLISCKVPYRIAHRVADKLREKYPHTGRRGSVLGGEDYDVVIQDHPPRHSPSERPHYC